MNRPFAAAAAALGALALSYTLVAVVSTSRADQAASTPSTYATLPDAPGRALMNRYCLACHSPGIVTSNRLSAKAWDGEVKKMVKAFGAQIPDADQTTIAQYLAQVLPPDKPLDPTPEVPAPR